MVYYKMIHEPSTKLLRDFKGTNYDEEQIILCSKNVSWRHLHIHDMITRHHI